MKKAKIKAAKHNFDLIVIGSRGMGSANEIQELANSSARILMTTMMDILGAAILLALVEIGVGILIVFMSRKMYKRTNALKFDTKIKQK